MGGSPARTTSPDGFSHSSPGQGWRCWTSSSGPAISLSTRERIAACSRCACPSSSVLRDACSPSTRTPNASAVSSRLRESRETSTSTAQHCPTPRGPRCCTYRSALALRSTGSGTWAGAAESDELTLTVPTVTLDEVLDADDRRVRFVKCDVEGHELAVLRGAAKVLENARPVLLVEIEWRHAGDAMHETFELLRAAGYAGEVVTPAGLRPLSDFDVDRDQLAYLGDERERRSHAARVRERVPLHLPCALTSTSAATASRTASRATVKEKRLSTVARPRSANARRIDTSPASPEMASTNSLVVSAGR